MAENMPTNDFVPFCHTRFQIHNCKQIPSDISTITAQLTSPATLNPFQSQILASDAMVLPTALFITISTVLTAPSTMIASPVLVSSQLPSQIPPQQLSGQIESTKSINMITHTPVLTSTGIGLTVTSASAGQSGQTNSEHPKNSQTMSGISQPAMLTSSALGPLATAASSLTMTPPLYTNTLFASNQASVLQSTSNSMITVSNVGVTPGMQPTCITNRSGSTDSRQCAVLSQDRTNDTHFGTGAIVGTVVAVVAIFALLGFSFCFWCRKSASKSDEDLERVKQWVENSVSSVESPPGRSSRGRSDPITSVGPKKSGNMPADALGPSLMTEDVLCNYSKASLRSSQLVTPNANPFKSPFDGSDDARASQIGLALTRYSTHASQRSKSNDTNDQKRVAQGMPDAACPSRGRDQSVKTACKGKPVPNRKSIGKVKSALTKPIRRSRSLSSVIALPRKYAYGSPEKLSKFYDIHTGAFLNLGPDNNKKNPGGQLSLKRSFTDSKLDDKDEEVVSREREDSGRDSFNRSRPRSESFDCPVLPGSFPAETNLTNYTTSRPPMTECELLGNHICDPGLRYKCHFSTIQLNRIANVAKRHHEKEVAAGHDVDKLQEEKQAWARGLLKQLEERKAKEIENVIA